MLEGLHVVEGLLTEGNPVGVHIVRTPLGRVLVAVWHQAPVVPLLVDALHAEEQLAGHHAVPLISQLDFLSMVVITT